MSQVHHSSDVPVLPWWKQRWPWILISGPLIAAIGCGITIWLAFSGVDQPIRDGVVKQGLKVLQTQDQFKSSENNEPSASKGAKE